MTPREYFEKSGKLFKCPNKSHKFQFGKVVGYWAWAKELWSDLTDKGYMKNHYLSLCTTETTDNLKIITLVVWRFKLSVGLI